MYYDTGGWCALLENYSTQCTIIPEYKSGEIHMGEMDEMEMGFRHIFCATLDPSYKKMVHVICKLMIVL